MLGTLLDLVAVGIIGLVSWIWISNYKGAGGGGGPAAGGSTDAVAKETTASGKPSRSGVAPPPVPKRTEAQIAQTAKEAKAREAAAAKERQEHDAAAAKQAAAAKEAAKQSAAAAKEAAKAEELAAKEAAKLAIAEERARLHREKEAELREKEAAEKKAAKSASLLSMAMQQPPELPKRPMINILHAPTLTQSIAFSPSPSPEAAGNSAASSSASSAAASSVASPSPSPADGGVISEEKAAKLAEHRKQVAWEIISSEEKYISSLHTLMVCYFTPLKAKSEKGSDKIKPAQHALLFSNIEALWKFHVMMLPSLKTAPDGDVAQVIEQHAPYLKMYTKYVADYTPAMQTVNALSKNEGFAKFLKKQRSVSEGMDLMSFLIMPVQRIPRYVLLLKELQKYTPATHPHSASIDAAISKLSAIASFINETQRSQENASLLLEFQNLIHELPPEIQLFQPHRKLVRHGLLKLIKQEGTTSYPKLGEELQTSLNPSYMCILFNDMIRQNTLQHNSRGAGTRLLCCAPRGSLSALSRGRHSCFVRGGC